MTGSVMEPITAVFIKEEKILDDTEQEDSILSPVQDGLATEYQQGRSFMCFNQDNCSVVEKPQCGESNTSKELVRTDLRNISISNDTTIRGNVIPTDYTCALCVQRFSTVYLLIRHVFSHKRFVNTPLHICKQCGQIFLNMSVLCAHNCQYSKKPYSKRSYSCKVCGKCFTCSGNLKRHQMGHSGVRPFSCAFCEKSFIHPGNLEVHERSHTGERPYCCEVCGKCFTCSGNLKRHQLIHSGMRPYSCDICGKSFTQPGCLKIHLRRHSGQRPFTCEICGKCFTNSRNRKIHHTNHSSDYILSYEPSRKSFTEAGIMKDSHSINFSTFSCEFCGKCFTRPIYLKRHLKMHYAYLSLSC